MKTRYRLIRRGVRGGGFYCVDNNTGKRTSLRTDSEDAARQIVEAKNNAERQPVLNLQIAKAYLAGSDNGITTRTWQHAIEALTNTKQDANKERWLAHVYGGAFHSAFCFLSAHTTWLLVRFMASLRLPAKKLESICL
jgi:hypothetical protein